MSESDRNLSTMFPRSGDRLATAAGAAELFARAMTVLPMTPRLGDAQGHRVFWLDEGSLRWRDVVDDERSYAIVGRHSQAHVRLRADPTIALRHLVLRSGRGPAGQPTLRVSDLLAPLPVFVDGSDSPERSLTAEGSLLLRVGAYAVCALPFDGCREVGEKGGPGASDRPDPDPANDDQDNPDELPPARPAAPPSRAPEPAASGWVPRGRHDSLYRMDSSSSRIEQTQPPVASDAWAVVRMFGGGGRSTFSLRREQLDGLVIIGRYERCHGNRAGMFGSVVSRMHLALTRRGDAVEALDLASRNGSAVGGRGFYRTVVGDGAVITLGGDGDRLEIELRGGGS